MTPGILRWQKAGALLMLLLLVLISATGCSKENGGIGSDNVPAATVAQEPTLSDQIGSVRNGNTTRIQMTKVVINDEDLIRELNADDHITVLLLDAGIVSDKGVKHVASIKTLEHIRLRESPVGNAGLNALAQCESLMLINLPDAVFDDTSLAGIASMPRLEMLRFHSPDVSDAGIQAVLKSKSLKFLHLIDVVITDASVPAIISCRNLQSLYIDGGNISDTGWQKLFDARSDLHIHVNQQHHDLDPADGEPFNH